MKELYYLIYGFIMGACLVANLKDIKKEIEIKRIELETRGNRQGLKELPEKCPRCGGEIKNIPAGVSKRTHQPYREFWVCDNPDCSFTANKRGGRFIYRWDKSQKPKSRTSEEKSKTRKLETKQEEIEDTDEIDVSKIPF